MNEYSATYKQLIGNTTFKVSVQIKSRSMKKAEQMANGMTRMFGTVISIDKSEFKMIPHGQMFRAGKAVQI